MDFTVEPLSLAVAAKALQEFTGHEFDPDLEADRSQIIRLLLEFVEDDPTGRSELIQLLLKASAAAAEEDAGIPLFS